MLYLEKDFYKNIHSSFIHGSPELERMQMTFSEMTFNGGMESWGYLYNGLLQNNIKSKSFT